MNPDCTCISSPVLYHELMNQQVKHISRKFRTFEVYAKLTTPLSLRPSSPLMCPRRNPGRWWQLQHGERLFVFSTWMRVCLRSTTLLSINVPTSSQRSPVGSNCASLNQDCCFRAEKGENWIRTALEMRFNVYLILFISHLHLCFLSEKYPCLFSEKSLRKHLCFSKPGLLLSSR